MKKIISVFIVLFVVFHLHAQQTDRCGFGMIQANLQASHPEMIDAQAQIEAFTADYIQRQETDKRTRATIYKIPVVVHVIHNGEAVGSGTNISYNQIVSQINVLNADFRLRNTDSLKTTHAFYSFTDDCEIEFCLATKDPSGNITTGVNRFDYSAPSYDYNYVEYTIKPDTRWDNKKYLNIWVVKFGGGMSTLLGYATPPGSPAAYDGVVVNTTNFGSTGNVTAPYNKGRTATHEIGHFLNLRHTWGDATCGNDLVSDTPPAEEANYNCPSFPRRAFNTCGAGANGEMYMNYMDYTNDACMKMFTTGQKNRMRATLATGGSRSTLTSSDGCAWPVGINEATVNTEFRLFPNPSLGHFYVSQSSSFGQDDDIQIYNALGQNVTAFTRVTDETPMRKHVEASSLPAGTYLIRISSKGTSVLQTIHILH